MGQEDDIESGAGGVVRTGLRMEAALHQDLTEHLRRLRYKTGKKISIDAAIAAALRLYLDAAVQKTGDVTGEQTKVLGPDTRIGATDIPAKSGENGSTPGFILRYADKSDRAHYEALSALLASPLRPIVEDVVAVLLKYAGGKKQIADTSEATGTPDSIQEFINQSDERFEVAREKFEQLERPVTGTQGSKEGPRPGDIRDPRRNKPTKKHPGDRGKESA